MHDLYPMITIIGEPTCFKDSPDFLSRSYESFLPDTMYLLLYLCIVFIIESVQELLAS